ncbi:unnamed protein product, partial [Mesorhabditis belari]|uniref:7TM GPCR serpentine receptor class x (Srx) domain-containing protein n=1 Tax=Mesorhabditis belari TaxID=2138241 RepID=A0AAF3EYQ6_9BILA
MTTDAASYIKLTIAFLEIFVGISWILLFIHILSFQKPRANSPFYTMFLANSVINIVYLWCHSMHFSLQSAHASEWAIWWLWMMWESSVIALHMGVVLTAFNRFCAIVQYTQYKSVLSRRGTLTYILVQLGTAGVVRFVLPPGNHPEKLQGGIIDRDVVLGCSIHFACSSAAVLLSGPLYVKSLQALFSKQRKGWKSSAVRLAEIKRIRFCLASLIFPLFYSILQLFTIGVVVKNHQRSRKQLEILGSFLMLLFVSSQPISVVFFLNSPKNITKLLAKKPRNEIAIYRWNLKSSSAKRTDRSEQFKSEYK